MASFATNVLLCKVNMHGELDTTSNQMRQDLNFNELTDTVKVDTTDSIEVETLVTVCSGGRLGSVIDNTQQNPTKMKLGKNKVPKVSFFHLFNALFSCVFT